MALLACGWLGVAVSGLCTVGFMNLGSGASWRSFLTLEGLLGGALFLVMFGFVPIGGGIAMFIFTRRALRARANSRNRRTSGNV